MYTLCFGCMKLKQGHPTCELCGFDEQAQNGNHQLPLGTVVGGQYILGKVLGQGGFGITYLAWDKILDRRVAVKEYFPSGYAGRDTRNPLNVTSYDNHSSHDFENNKKRFLREAESLAKLWDVPQIVKILRHFEDNGTAYIAMEYVEGTDLRKFLKKLGRPMTMAETLQILGPVMEALSRVHRIGLVHRDISPDNIMVLPDGSAKLLDFGAARYVENANPETERNTSTQSILKHGFAPPEQYRSHGALGPWTDVYAMCATIYHCLTGKVPPEAMGRTMEGEEIDWTIPGLTGKQKSVLAKGMEILPKNRFASIDELWEALSPNRSATVQKTAEPIQPEEKAPVSAQKTKKRKKKWIPLLAGLLLTAIIAAGSGVFLLKGPTYTYKENQNGITITGVSGWNIPEEMKIPDRIDDKRVTAIGTDAFKGREDLIKVTIPTGVQSIGTSAFANCRNLTGITIPKTVNTIGGHAFESCTALKGISIPSSVASIGSYAFSNCQSLGRVFLTKGLQNLGNGVFQHCTNLREISIPEGVLFIHENTFINCTSLENVTLAVGVRTIGDSAFQQCTSLKTVHLPGSVTHIGNSAFSSCSALEEIVIPEHVGSIGDSAFKNCARLQNVTFPKSLLSIGEDAFEYCPKFTEAAIPAGCSLDANAFPVYCNVTRYE